MRSLKKLMALLLALLCIICVTACAKDGDTDKKAEGFSVKYNDVELVLGAEAADVLEELGEANSSDELFDCGAGNSRMLYRYSSFDLYTMKSDGKEVIDQIELKDDVATTDLGIYIGSDEAKVRSEYGEPDREGKNGITYKDGELEVTFDIKDGKVSGIGLLRVTQ